MSSFTQPDRGPSGGEPTIADVAAITRRLRGLSTPGRAVDPAQRAAFLADKDALIARITAPADSDEQMTGRPAVPVFDRDDSHGWHPGGSARLDLPHPDMLPYAGAPPMEQLAPTEPDWVAQGATIDTADAVVDDPAADEVGGYITVTRGTDRAALAERVAALYEQALHARIGTPARAAHREDCADGSGTADAADATDTGGWSR